MVLSKQCITNMMLWYLKALWDGLHLSLKRGLGLIACKQSLNPIAAL